METVTTWQREKRVAVKKAISSIHLSALPPYRVPMGLASWGKTWRTMRVFDRATRSAKVSMAGIIRHRPYGKPRCCGACCHSVRVYSGAQRLFGIKNCSHCMHDRRSEEHTSALQSRGLLVCRLL